MCGCFLFGHGDAKESWHHYHGNSYCFFFMYTPPPWQWFLLSVSLTLVSSLTPVYRHHLRFDLLAAPDRHSSGCDFFIIQYFYCQLFLGQWFL